MNREEARRALAAAPTPEDRQLGKTLLFPWLYTAHEGGTMDATLTIKASPAQFDVLREALATAITRYKEIADDPSRTASSRREYRLKATEAEAILSDLR